MFKRHAIRIKVLQALYSETLTAPQSELSNPTKALTLYHTLVSEATLLPYFLLDILLQIADYATHMAEVEKNKLLTSSIDPYKLQNPLARNRLLDVCRNLRKEFLTKNPKSKFIRIEDKDVIHRLYSTLRVQDTYKQYALQVDAKASDDIQIIIWMLTELIQQSEAVESLIEDHFLNAVEDTETAFAYLIEKLSKFPAIQLHSEPKELENIDFGKELLQTALRKKTYFYELIFEKSEHWDKDRIVLIDKVILMLALAEFLYFDYIPLSVTLNEYIEIAKEFSTPDSKNFINGMLDTLQKNLTLEGKISPQKKPSSAP